MEVQAIFMRWYWRVSNQILCWTNEPFAAICITISTPPKHDLEAVILPLVNHSAQLLKCNTDLAY